MSTPPTPADSSAPSGDDRKPSAPVSPSAASEIPSTDPAASSAPSAVPSAPLRPSRPPTPSSDELKDIVDSINASIQQNRGPPPEIKDERCFTWNRQTNRRRAIGLQPRSTSLCYINFKNELDAIAPLGAPPTLVPVENQPGHFVVVPAEGATSSSLLVPATIADKTKDTQRLAEPKPRQPSAVVDGGVVVPAYEWKFLNNRFLYYASGRETVIKHMNEMGGVGWKGVSAMIERCEAGDKAREEKNTVLGRRGRKEQRNIRLALGFPDEADDYETMINLSSLYSNSLRRFHTHLHRIYSPVYKNIVRLPETFRDGTQRQMVDTVYTRLTDGSALKLAERMYTSTVQVIKTFRERASGGGSSGGGGGGGLGGLGGGGGAAM